MRRHWNRTVCYFIGDEQPIVEPPYLTDGDAAAETTEKVYLRFGRLFDRHDPKDVTEESEMVQKLVELGKLMTDLQGNAPPHPDDPTGDSDIPAGYTYLGQFITHEITFHDTQDLHANEGYQNDELFECARKLVVQHFQWLILEDYLPRILDRGVLRCACAHPPLSE